ncbi:hypothetical protein GCM10009554_05630 [Kribbella koreensis]|uniref:Uncharacterized protein n=2 Tax=Kribbella TaxID=182639 RepID=A0ABP6XHS4_9ACTN
MSAKLPKPTNFGADNPSQFVSDNQNPCSAGQNTHTASTANGTKTNARINGDTRQGRRSARPDPAGALGGDSGSTVVAVTP